VQVNREQALSVLCDLAFTIGGELDLDALLTKTLQRFLYHTGFPAGFMLSHRTLHEQKPVTETMLDAAIGDYGFIKRQGLPMTVPTALLAPEPALLDMPAALASLGTRKPMHVALSLPIAGYGHMLLLSPRTPDTELPLTELFLPVLSHLATTITLCREYANTVQRRIEREAYYDPVTELPNANLFNEALQEGLQRTRRSARMLAVVYLDLDDFATYNDRFGHASTDRMLASFARQLDASVHPSEFLSRMMADEFIIMLPDLSHPAQLEGRLAAILGRRYAVAMGQQSVPLSITAGVSVFPVDAVEADTLIRHAQIAMHEAKSNNRGRYRMFDAEQDRLAQERRAIQDKVAVALEKGQLVLYYQPQVDMRSGKIIGFEALLRWNDPDRGIRPPGDFLPSVETSNLICDIGRWALEQAMQQSVVWRAEGLSVPISVNIAGRHLLEENFLEQVEQVFIRNPLARRQDLEIEVLETTAIEDFDKARSILNKCRALGLKTALDDFGTGYSSLAYLSQLPANTLKIDQMFVRSLFEKESEPAIIRAIVQIAEIFGCHVIAEGVETEEHGLVLLSMGCHLAQGYGIARPMPADQVLNWSRNYRAPGTWTEPHRQPWSHDRYEALMRMYRERTQS
jgi:diguanylate cyclase (GGDEF)-like protein